MTEMIFISAPHGHSRGSTSKIFRNKRGGGPLDRVVSLHSKLLTCAAYRDYPSRSRYNVL